MPLAFSHSESSAWRARVDTISPRANEVSGDGYSLIEQATWVIAKIENECLQLTVSLLPERLDCLFHCRVRLLGELR